MFNKVMSRYEEQEIDSAEQYRNILIFASIFTILMITMAIVGENYMGINKPMYIAIATFMATTVVLILRGRGKTARGFFIIGAIAASCLFPVTNRIGLYQADGPFFMVCISLLIAIYGYIKIGNKALIATIVVQVLVYLYLMFSHIPEEWLQKTVAILQKKAPNTDLMGTFTIFMMMNYWNMFRTRKYVEQIIKAKIELSQQNVKLEKEVKNRTAALKTVLDNCGQGFITFGKDMVVEKGASRESRIIIGEEVEGRTIGEILFNEDEMKINELHEGMQMIFEGNVETDIIFNLQEKEVKKNERIIAIEYRKITDERILCILTDITEKKTQEEREKEEKEKQERMFKVLNNKITFGNYVADAETIIEECYSTEEMAQERRDSFKRALHTFKGNSAFYGFNRTMEIAHEIETQLQMNEEINGGTIVMLEETFHNEMKDITDVMGARWLEEINSVKIDRNEYKAIIKNIKKIDMPDKEIIRCLEDAGKVELKELMSRLPERANVIAEKLGKRIKPAQYSIEAIKVDYEKVAPLTDTFVHLVNNMLDHGIEYPKERDNNGKEREGQIVISAKKEGDKILFIFSDDGRGIDIEAVRKRAIERGLVEPNKNIGKKRMLGMIFEQGFSTKEDASIYSGRGVGLSSVREQVKRLKGNISITTTRGAGTTFEIRIPA